MSEGSGNKEHFHPFTLHAHFPFLRMKSLLIVVVVVAVVNIVPSQATNCTCPDEVDVNCPPTGDDAVFFPHPDDCSMYCECEAEGCGSELDCPPGLLFDEDLNVCSWPDDVSIPMLAVGV